MVRKRNRGNARKGISPKQIRTNYVTQTLDEYFDLFYDIKTAEGKASSTLEQYRNNYKFFKRFLDMRYPYISISEIDRKVCRDYIRYMREEAVRWENHKFLPKSSQTVGLSIETVNTRLKTLRVFFGCLVDEKGINENPMEGVKNLRKEESNISVLNEDELRRLLMAPNQISFPEFRDYVLMYLLVDSMMRIGEAQRLQIQDFDLYSNAVTIPAAIAKSRRARTIMLQVRTIKLIKELYAENKTDFDTNHIFLTNYGEPMERNHFRKRLIAYAKKAGITKKVHPHILRHTAATMFLEDGGDIRHLQMILGHSDMRMVQRYTHPSEKSVARQQSAHSAINKVIGKLNKPRKRKRNIDSDF
ncbi:tyrosine-type recombinase/integrase [Terribacillus saccharophilus]|uniref:Integrase n=1 Tax=Terribacillus saccharophilus TaxID=361277 RepID=A0ABX4H0A4_9BACI|nr:tyrosine-type recombinase/integrase [Terribacillus saccharophilus]PAD35959.1 hypothetical protein CHH56_05910 [Terribacillus saccharophilus]PAD96991.1 hypothetical protein CHH50_06400 [Terribacillus saccharophilus]PAE00567.1 hypothetical protein CHH48_07305 [Terribacillus saccharophilus]